MHISPIQKKEKKLWEDLLHVRSASLFANLHNLLFFSYFFDFSRWPRDLAWYFPDKEGNFAVFTSPLSHAEFINTNLIFLNCFLNLNQKKKLQTPLKTSMQWISALCKLTAHQVLEATVLRHFVRCTNGNKAKHLGRAQGMISETWWPVWRPALLQARVSISPHKQRRSCRNLGFKI